MSVWLTLLALVFAARAALGSLESTQSRIRYLAVVGAGVVAVMGLRHPLYSGSNDLRNYYRLYERLIDAPWSDIFTIVPQLEPGYVIANKILATVVPWPQFILIAVAGFCVFAISRFVYLNTHHTFEGMLYYVTLGTMEFQLTGFRQAIAIGICLLGLETAKSRHPFRFALIVLIAATFHRTAIVFLLAYFVVGQRPTFSKSLMGIAALVASVYVADILTVQGNTLFGTAYGEFYVGNVYGGVVPILIFLAVIVLSLLKRTDVQRWTGFNLTVTGLVFYVMRYVTLAIERVSFYFTPGVIIGLPEAVSSEGNPHLRAALRVFSVSGAVGLFLYRAAQSDWGAYRFFWQ